MKIKIIWKRFFDFQFGYKNRKIDILTNLLTDFSLDKKRNLSHFFLLIFILQNFYFTCSKQSRIKNSYVKSLNFRYNCL